MPLVHLNVTEFEHCAPTPMQFEAWTTQFDSQRATRLAIGFAVGLCSLGGFFTFLALTASAAEEEVEAEITEIKLQEEPEQKMEKEEPEPEPEEASPDEVVAAAGPRLAALKPPTEIPDDAPKEKEPSKDGEGGTDPYAATGGKARSGTVGGTGTGTGEKPVAKVEEEKKPVAPSKPKGPVRLDENMTPPKPISMGAPVFPDSLKSQGIEGVVVMKYVVDANGNVTGAKRIQGPQELAAVVWAAMRNWKFEPARDAQGNAVSVTRIYRTTFTIKTD